LEDLSIVFITGAQHINGGFPELETNLEASEQGIPFQPCFIEFEPLADDAVTEAT